MRVLAALHFTMFSQYFANPASATQAVLWGGLAIGILFGLSGQASRFCVRGAVADWVTFGGTGRALSWLLAVAVAAIGTAALIGAGAFDPTRTLAWSPRFPWLSYLAGGAILGWGMVLAGGCPQRNLVKAGAGSLRAVVVLVVAAVAGLMTLRGLLAVPRVELLDAAALTLGRPQDLGSLASAWLPVSAGTVRAMAVAALAAATAVLLWRGRAQMDRSMWIGSVIVGLLVPAAWLLTGWLGHLAEHPETLEEAWLGTQSKRPEGLSFTAPLAHTLDLLTLWSDRNTTVTFGVAATLGVLAGSFASAKARGEFRFESFKSVPETIEHLIGGVLIGFGGVTALGCSIGQGVTGLAMLSAGAVLAVAGMVSGCWGALRVQAWRMEAADARADKNAGRGATIAR
jgi:uncharacterized membrane protein YedE/YeeE